MINFYKFSVIPILLKNFKVKKAIISGLEDNNLINEILNYDAEFTAIDSEKTHPNIKTINGNSLDMLKFQKNYDAIFINDDPNWYTIYNELNIIKKTNDEFPIVFICNNRFPHKRRDTYKNPELIPPEFRQKYVNTLPIFYDDNEIIIEDGNFHACDENTSKNGVLTAIEDFLNENPNISQVDIKFIEEITILCQKSTITKIRVDNTKKEIEDKKLNIIGLSDKIVENQLLLSYLDTYDIREPDSSEKINKKIIDEYENKIHIQDSRIKFKDSQIIGVNSELNVKDLEIKSIESKLVNRDNKITNLENKLKSANDDINFLKNEIKENESYAKNQEADYKFKIKTAEEEIDELKSEILKTETDLTKANNKLKTVNNELKTTNNKLKLANDELNNIENEMKNTKKILNNIKKSNTHQTKQLNSKEYCISCYKEEISNNKIEIDYFKNQTLIKKILSPFSYLYLIAKSNPRELSLNFKLYKSLKNSKCFDIGYYLKNNEDIQKSKWIKYFSPELHYICNGFKEKREFNKKYFNRNSKKELLDYLLTCENE